MAYSIDFTAHATSDLKALRAYEQRRIVEAIERQPRHQPADETRNRKSFGELTTSFEYRPPIWELRVGDYRVIYRIDEKQQLVAVSKIAHRSAAYES